ncbi:MAG: metallophosphoesterase [Verrucomicrobiota bacterium]
MTHQGEGTFRLEQFVPIDRIAELGLSILGLRHKARKNIYEINVVEQTWHLRRLPPAFDGFRLMQLSDLHIDLDEQLADTIADRIATVDHDACVITGDYRNSTNDDYGPSMQLMVPILSVLSKHRWGILGNHDFIEEVWHLESAGLPILLNESTAITRDGQKLWIAGVDDQHFYEVHDFERAQRNVPVDQCCILLCHSPEPHDEASRYDFDLMLSGHTHGGQLCLPGGHHLVCPVKNLAKPFIKGRWRSNNLLGYTSPGTGSCAIAARLNCPPEITIHILRTHPSENESSN